MSTDFAKMMLEAKLPERSVSICMRGDLVAELERLERAAEDLRRNHGTASMEGDGAAEVVEQIRALQAEMQGSTYEFLLRAMPPRRYRVLKAKYPPRRDDEGEVDQADVQRGFSLEMIPELIRISTVDPQLTAEQWRELLGDSDAEAARLEQAGKPVEEGKLTEAQCWQLGNAAHLLNEGEISVPLSPAVLLTRRSIGGASKSPSGSGTPRQGSTAGSRRKSPDTTTTGEAG